jgi:hypothetical protein
MYALARLCFVMALGVLGLAFLAGFLLVFQRSPGWAIIIGLGVVAVLAMKKGAGLWKMGTARWATADELYKRGMLE